MSSSSWKTLPALAAIVMFATAPAAAQVCGDADGNGTVTVTDGVQTLRAAAGLSSSCTKAACDVDGNQAITVTDGVNVLRIAAGLSVTLSCPSIDAQVQNLLSTSLPIFGNLTKLGSSSSANARAAETQQCDNSDGFVTIDQSTGQLTFQNCDLDGFNYNGTFVVGQDALSFDITFTDLSTGESERLNGALGQQLDQNQNVAVSGEFQLTSPLGGFDVQFAQLEADPNTGLFVSGQLAFSVQSGQLSAIQDIQMAFHPSNVADVQVDLADGSSLPFNYNLVSGALTPVSN